MRDLLLLSAFAGFLLLINITGISKLLLSSLTPEKTANPAANYCLEQGGARVVKTGQNGNVFGFCQFPNGSICEEWSFYQGTCQHLQNLPQSRP